MAKKKDFSNIVEESFNDGYVSEPDVEVTAKEPEKVEEATAPAEELATEVVEETLTPPAEETTEAALEQVAEETVVEEVPVVEAIEEIVEEPEEEPEEELTESEILLKRLTDGDEELLEELWNKQERATYYLTNVQRACIDIVARDEVLTKNAVVNAAYEKYFSDAVKEAAKEEVVRRTIKTLKRQIEVEKKNKED